MENTPLKLNKFVRLADYFGMTASMVCLVHCMATPLLLSLFPLIGLGHDDKFHEYMIVAATVPALLALIPGFLRHRRWQVFALSASGLGLFITAEAVLAVAGGVLLFSAHFQNRAWCKSCK